MTVLVDLIWLATGAVLALFVVRVHDLWRDRHIIRKLANAITVLAGYIHHKNAHGDTRSTKDRFS